MKNKKKSIDNVTVDLLNAALTMCDIRLSEEVIDKILDLVELIEENGEYTSTLDIQKLKDERVSHGYPSKLSYDNLFYISLN